MRACKMDARQFIGGRMSREVPARCTGLPLTFFLKPRYPIPLSGMLHSFSHSLYLTPVISGRFRWQAESAPAFGMKHSKGFLRFLPDAVTT